MGLDISFDAFHGAYSCFGRLRHFICKSLGGSYPHPGGHEDNVKFPDANRFYLDDKYTYKKYPALYEFLSHSDCDGEIEWRVAGKLADSLTELMPMFEELAKTEQPFGHTLYYGGYIAQIQQFISGCRSAVEAKKPLVFL